MATALLTLAALNRMPREEFCQTLGGVVEQSPWVAESAWSMRPFGSVDELHAAMTTVVRQASRAEQLALLRAHPDLAGKAARAGAMTGVSIAEQSSAGLDRLSDEEYARFGRLNAAYRERFGFPFIIAVRKHDKAAILAAFDRRLGHTTEEEIEAALEQVLDITRLRLHTLVQDPVSTAGLTTHVLDTARGRPAAGLRIDLSAVEADGRTRAIKTVTTNADGRCDAPLLGPAEMKIGRYELVFHAAAYFRASGVTLADPPFLEQIPVRFAIAEPGRHYHVPLLVSPYGYVTYRGS